MDSYFKVFNLAGGVFHIYEPGGVYTTLIVGEKRALLIDTGYGFANLAEFVRTLTDKPLDVVATHGHIDHTGGNYLFPSVYMNLEEAPTYLWNHATQKPTFIAKFRKDRAAAGLPDVWPEDFNVDQWIMERTKSFERLQDGQIFDLGGRKERIIFMPGHTVGSVLVLDDKTGLLFSGDNISDSLWILFNTSVSLSSYVSNLMDVSLLPIKGIVASHKGFIMSAGIIQDILRTIGCIDPETDKLFIHPRTGQKALKHREKCRSMDEIEYIYVVYNKNNI